MKATRLTIGGALGLIALSGLCFAGLRNHTLFWAQFFFTSAIATLLIVTIGAVVAQHKALWIGASILGWGYWICVFVPWFRDDIRPWLLSTSLIDEMFLRFIAPGIVDKNSPFSFDFLTNAGAWSHEPNFANFSRTGQSISTLIHAVQGAIVGWLFDWNRRRRGVE